MSVKSIPRNSNEILQLKRSELAPHEVLSSLYGELTRLGEVKREVQGNYVLASDSNYSRNDVSALKFNGVITGMGNKDFIFLHGSTDKRLAHLSAVDHALMFGEIDWKKLPKNKEFGPWPENLPETSAVQALTDAQVHVVIHHSKSLSGSRMIRVWEDQLDIRDGFEGPRWTFRHEPIPNELVNMRDGIRQKETRYAVETVPFLLTYLYDKLSIETSIKPRTSV